MRSIGELISSNRKKKKMSQTALARALTLSGHQVSNKAVSKWETDSSEPSVTIFFDICRILGIPDMYEEYFGLNPANPMSALNDLGKDKVREYIDLLKLDPAYLKKLPSPKIVPIRTLPMQLYPVSAGPGNFLDDENYEDIPVSEEVPSSADFAVRVSGDSMEPLLHKNQIIYIHKQETLENGDIGIFFLDGEAYVKKFQNDARGTFLISLNTNYAPKPVTAASDFRIFGRMVY